MTIARARWPLAAAGALVLAVLIALLPSPAEAHAVLERSLPLQNQTLEEPPELVETWYSEPLERSLTELKVLDTEGNEVHEGSTFFSDDDGRYAAVALPPDLGPGIYTVTYVNVSTVDGHQWAGSISFVVLNPDGSQPAGTAFQADVGSGQGFLPGVGETAFRWTEMIAAVALFGALAFYLFVVRPASGFLNDDEQERVQDASMALAAGITIVAVPVLIASLLGQLFLLADRLGGPGRMNDILFDTRTGELWLARIGVSLALALLFAPALFSKGFRTGSRTTVIVWAAAAGVLGLLMTFSLNSHAEASGGSFWAVGSDFVHLAATGAWLGALLQLPLVYWWSRRRLDDSRRLLYLANVLDRFSWLAVVSVVLLIGTGVFNSFVQLPVREAFWETTYGRVLIAKLALIVPMLGVAVINAVFLKPALVEAIDALHDTAQSERPSARVRERFERRLARVGRALPWTTALEFALGAAVLVSVSVLAQSTTADGELRQEASMPSGEVSVPGATRSLELELLIEPFGLGVNTYTVTLAPKAGEELGEVLGVDLIASFDDPDAPPSAGRSGTRQELDPTAEPNVWAADAVLLTQPGEWRVETRIQRRGFDDEVTVLAVSDVGGFLARTGEPEDLFDLPFTFVDWNTVAGGAMVALGLGAFLIWRNRPPSWQLGTANSVGLASLCGLIAGAVLIFGIDVHQPEMRSDSPIEPTRDALAQGQELFEANCIQCHGPTGEGGPVEGLTVEVPRYIDHVPYHDDATLFVWVTDGIESQGQRNMPAFGELLTEDERWTLVTWLRQFFGTPGAPTLPEDLASAE